MLEVALNLTVLRLTIWNKLGNVGCSILFGGVMSFNELGNVGGCITLRCTILNRL